MTASSPKTSELMIKHFTGEITPDEKEELENIINGKPAAKQQWYRDRLDPEKVAASSAFARSVDREKYRRQREEKARQQGEA